MPTRARSCTDVLARLVDVVAVEQDATRDPGAEDRVVHPVEAAQEGRLAAAGRADHRQHLLATDVDAQALMACFSP